LKLEGVAESRTSGYRPDEVPSREFTVHHGREPSLFKVSSFRERTVLLN